MAETPYVTPQTPAAPAAGMRTPLSGIDVLAFLCQILAFGSLAFWGFVAWPFPWNIVAGIGAPALAILVWALFVSPRAVFAVHPFVRAVVELLVYVAATIAWWSMDMAWVGLAFGVVAVTVGVFAGRRRLA
ncbi:YrdB family protein [Microbacterium sp. NPDC055910]|uniref:YrdB family protein n=1 Tax=Microbacterium sp. NPDC055910 TaxID=3345659 RepID=UPI0035DC8311